MEIRFFLLWFGVKDNNGELLHAPIPSELENLAMSLAPRAEKLRDLISYLFIGNLLITLLIISKVKGII